MVNVPKSLELQSARNIQAAGDNKEAGCADEASKVFKQNGYDSAKFADSYTDHWNKVLSKCFIFISSMRGEGNKLTTSKFLADAFENKVYGELFMFGATGSNATPLQCAIYKNGDKNDMQTCTSTTEFDNLVASFMSN